MKDNTLAKTAIKYEERGRRKIERTESEF